MATCMLGALCSIHKIKPPQCLMQGTHMQVDTDALGLHDYHQVIRHPMDLGTVKRRLMAEPLAYSSSADALRDVQQVWANCRSYNDEDDPIMYVMHVDVECSVVPGRVHALSIICTEPSSVICSSRSCTCT